MTEYAFTLKWSLPPSVRDMDDVAERLAAAGCDDALVGIGRKGRIALDFIREAECASDAVLSAIADVRSALTEATLVEAAPDLVGLTDVAGLLGVSRQNMRKLVLDCPPASPLPVHEGNPTIWRLAKILGWLRDEKGYAVDVALVELAATTMQVNLALELSLTDHSLQEEILSILA